eukprot:scaffold6873_cov50-Phaeocystis_antarctica.AAC.2
MPVGAGERERRVAVLAELVDVAASGEEHGERGQVALLRRVAHRVHRAEAHRPSPLVHRRLHRLHHRRLHVFPERGAPDRVIARRHLVPNQTRLAQPLRSKLELLLGGRHVCEGTVRRVHAPRWHRPVVSSSSAECVNVAG